MKQYTKRIIDGYYTKMPQLLDALKIAIAECLADKDKKTFVNMVKAFVKASDWDDNDKKN